MSDRPAAGLPRLPTRHPPGGACETLLQTVRAYEATQALLARRAAAVGLTLAEFDVLGTASDLGEVSQRAVADHLLLTRAGVGRVLDRLELRGLVQRREQPGDRRVRLVSLTAQGTAALARARTAQVEVIAATIGALPACSSKR